MQNINLFLWVIGYSFKVYYIFSKKQVSKDGTISMLLKCLRNEYLTYIQYLVKWLLNICSMTT